MEEKLTKRKQLASDLNEIKRARKLWREYEQREIEEENKRIAKYIQERDAKLEKEQAEANARKLQTNGLVDKMCAELEEIEVSFIHLFTNAQFHRKILKFWM